MRHAQLVMGPAGCGVQIFRVLCVFVRYTSLLVTLLNLEVCCLILPQAKVSWRLLSHTTTGKSCSLHCLSVKNVVSYYHRQKYVLQHNVRARSGKQAQFPHSQHGSCCGALSVSHQYRHPRSDISRFICIHSQYLSCWGALSFPHSIDIRELISLGLCMCVCV